MLQNSEHWRLICISGPRRRENRLLSFQEHVIGSAEESWLTISPHTFPSRYAKILVREERCYLSALSPGGVFLDGDRVMGISERELRDGDVILLADESWELVAPNRPYPTQDELTGETKSRWQVFFAGMLLFGIAGIYYFESITSARPEKTKQEFSAFTSCNVPAALSPQLRQSLFDRFAGQSIESLFSEDEQYSLAAHVVQNSIWAASNNDREALLELLRLASFLRIHESYLSKRIESRDPSEREFLIPADGLGGEILRSNPQRRYLLSRRIESCLQSWRRNSGG